jgi:hypothetical protein
MTILNFSASPRLELVLRVSAVKRRQGLRLTRFLFARLGHEKATRGVQTLHLLLPFL